MIDYELLDRCIRWAIYNNFHIENTSLHEAVRERVVEWMNRPHSYKLSPIDFTLDPEKATRSIDVIHHISLYASMQYEEEQYWINWENRYLATSELTC